MRRGVSARLAILACGVATSLQDGGRRGFLRQGLSASGPMDRLALAMANVLVGNRPDTVAIEFGLGGGRFTVEGDAILLALAGAPCPIRRDGEPLPDHESFVLHEGSVLEIARPRSGMFAYLAVAGGIRTPPVLGSRSLHFRAALGGWHGRALREGDRLPIGPAPVSPARRLDPADLNRDEPIRVVLGPQDDAFPAEAVATLLGEAFIVSNRADRMGYQLDGPAIAHGPSGYNIVSDGTVAGSIQVPGSGQPIVLLADRQTTGGYPKIATVVSADLRRLAQRRPGDVVRFSEITVTQAVQLARMRAAEIDTLPTRLTPVMSEVERLLAANLAGNAVDALNDTAGDRG